MSDNILKPLYSAQLKHCLICKLEIDFTVTGSIYILNPRLRVCGSGGAVGPPSHMRWWVGISFPVLLRECQNGEPEVHSRSLNQWIVSQLLPTLDQVALRLLSIPAQSLLTCILHFLASDLTYLGTNLSLMRHTIVGGNIKRCPSSYLHIWKRTTDISCLLLHG